jgi:hypothetical protein
MLDALGDPRHADVRDTAVLVLRHWIGRNQGQSHRWFEFVTKQGYTPTQAKNMLHLLNGLQEEKLPGDVRDPDPGAQSRQAADARAGPLASGAPGPRRQQDRL